MIRYYGRFGNYLGQASAVPPDAPLVGLQTPIGSTPVLVAPAPSAVSRDLEQLDGKVTLSKGAILVGGLVLAGLTLTLTSSLLRRR